MTKQIKLKNIFLNGEFVSPGGYTPKKLSPSGLSAPTFLADNAPAFLPDNNGLPPFHPDNNGFPLGETLEGGNSKENYFYKRLFACSICEAKFQSIKHLTKHFEGRHPNKPISYNFVVVCEHYLKERIGKCKTKVLTFAHKDMENPCDREKKVLNSCMLRVCPKCEKTRRMRYIKKYQNALLNFKRVNIITLTIKDYHPLSKEFKKRIEKQIRNLIKRLERINPNLQYIRVLEIKRKSENLWYYHYHLLMDLCFLRQEKLSKMWQEISGSSVVWIEILRDDKGRAVGVFWNRLKKKEKIENASRYITKYLAKPIPLKEENQEEGISLDEYARIFYKAHFVETRIDFTCSDVQNSSTDSWLICENCNQKLEFCGCEDLNCPKPIIKPLICYI